MSTNEHGDAEATSASVADSEWLLRLNFSPEHIVNGQVIPTAVSLSDLKSRGYSVDRERLLDLRVILDRVSSQKVKAPHQREAPYLSRFQCGPLCRELDSDGCLAFKVEASPIEGNRAHAHILSAKARGEGGLRKLRNLLLPYLQNLIELEEYARHGAVRR